MADRENDAPGGLPRTLGLDGAPNARDVGGRRTADGALVATGLVFRSGALNRLSDDDLRALGAPGVGTVIDLRGGHELEVEGPDRLPDSVAGVPMPIYDAEADIYKLMMDLIGSQDPERQRATLGDGGADRMMVDIYRWMVADPTAREQVGRVLRHLAGPGQAPTLYHCTAGKDRTGWVTAVLHTLLGVPADQVRADYLASNDLLRPVGTALLDGLRGNNVMPEPELLTPLLAVREHYLAAAFAEADARFGSFDGFVADGLGLDRAAVDTLRAWLLRP